MGLDKLTRALKNINLPEVHPFYSWEEMADTRDIAIDAPEKSEKYRWHDMRKDPKDSPNKCEIYIICIEYPTGAKEIGMGYYKNMYGYRGVWSPLMPNDGKVIAWREIEPFEENEV